LRAKPRRSKPLKGGAVELLCAPHDAPSAINGAHNGSSTLRRERLKRTPFPQLSEKASLSTLLPAALAVFLAACGASPRETFDLASDSPNLRPAAGMRARARFVVGEPDAIPPANSDRIVIRTGSNAVANLGGAQWADRLPRLVQAQILEGFERAGVPATIPGKAADFSFATEIRRFEIDAPRGLAVVEIAARVIDDRSNVQRAERVFIAESPAPHTNGPEATRSLKEALETTIAQMTRWARSAI
jgi:cholesterol transport system auxiliary component